jgi:hypothetical protein
MIEQNKAPEKVSTDTTSARRSFLKKAAISAPILTTIAARPVWAGQCSLSGNLSNNVSHHDDSQPCRYNIFSPGGWLNGRATGTGDNANLWPYTGFSLSSPLVSLLPTTSFNGSIADALGGGSHGWERQAACAALNATIWDYGLQMCELDPNCQIIQDLPTGFYFPFTLLEIQQIYAAGPDKTQQDAWEAMQNL